MVVRESPTHDKDACDNLCSYLASEFECLGGQVQNPSANVQLEIICK